MDIRGDRQCAAQDGIGLTCVLEPSPRNAIDAGLLQCVWKPWLPPLDDFHLYYPSRVQALPKLRVFIDFVRKGGQRGAAAKNRPAVTRQPTQR
jgi:DNA-binding transcriptional LysR family regulator